MRRLAPEIVTVLVTKLLRVFLRQLGNSIGLPYLVVSLAEHSGLLSYK